MTDTGTETIAVPDTVEELLGDELDDRRTAWIVIVWDDPVNLMDYVVYVFQKLFGYSRAKATQAHAPGAQRGQGRREQRNPRIVRRSTSPGCTRTGSGRRCNERTTEWGPSRRHRSYVAPTAVCSSR